MREFSAVTRTLARSCASTAMIYLMHVCGAQAVAASGSPEKGRVVRAITSRNELGTLAFSERGSRSHFWAPVSRAVRNQASSIPNCDKSFVTSAGYADFYVVSSGAVTAKGPLDSTLYLVERDAVGVEISGPWNGMGLRGNASGPMTLRRCHVKDDHRLSDEAAGLNMMLSVVLPWFQVGSASASLGIADAAFAGAVKHTSSARLEHLGESLAAAVPGIRARLAHMNDARFGERFSRPDPGCDRGQQSLGHAFTRCATRRATSRCLSNVHSQTGEGFNSRRHRPRLR